MIKENDIQKFPVSDSPNTDAFEAIVELYYQLKGYITSSGKWFWVAEKSKHQRGYQDCDVLAINQDETIIISTTSNLNDKLSFTQKGMFDEDKKNKLNNFFNRVEQYLRKVPQYTWLVCQPRGIKKVVAYITFPKTKVDKIKKISGKKNILLLSSQKMINFITNYLTNHQENIKVQNQVLRMLHVLQINEKYYKGLLIEQSS